MTIDTELPAQSRSWTFHPSELDDGRLSIDHLAGSVSLLMHSVKTLAATDAFRPRFTVENWRILGSYLMRRTLKGNDVLIRQGESDRTTYLLESGTLLVHARRETGSSPISLLRAGAIVGEPALFGETVRMAQVDALAPCVVWSLTRSRLEELRAGHPELAYEILRAAGASMAERMRSTLAHGTPLL
ncbi:MAG: cyclic nucleotide-binding domain-containing protein [Burkholderiaceae bacterium]